jgi:2,5-diamino-6-(ribosylamino)-4(3H)-pyrimidinone 5'-phosphate reductase
MPWVGVNMAMSADGKVSTYRRETFSLGSPWDRYLMDILRAKADAVIVGSRTLSLDGWAVRVRHPAIRRRRLKQKRGAHPLNVVLSTDLRIPARSEFFTFPETEKLVITTRRAPKSRVDRFRTIAEVRVLPAASIAPQQALAVLADRGVRRVLLEGGGTLNFSFFRENLVDEIYITVTPRILGGDTAPTPVDGKGFLRAAQVRLRLSSLKRRDDEVFLKYEVIKNGARRGATGRAPRP